MIKNLITPILFIVLSAALFAQPANQDLSKIDPRLNNGFVMTPRQLTIKEFKGKEPRGTSSTSDIKTFIGLQKLQATVIKGNTSKYLFKIIPYFSFNSWITRDARKCPGCIVQILKHEQNHYDIHLLMANELKNELTSTFFDSRNYAPAILEIRDKKLRLESKINQLYEIETSNGQDTIAQKKWNERVAGKNWQALVKYVNGKI